MGFCLAENVVDIPQEPKDAVVNLVIEWATMGAGVNSVIVFVIIISYSNI